MLLTLQTMANAKNPDLERYLLLAKGAKGAACKAVIDEVQLHGGFYHLELNTPLQALSCPSVHVFGEFLALPNVADVRAILVYNGLYTHHAAQLEKSHPQHFNRLQLFAHGTYQQYKGTLK